jgi:hypothetical protein
MTTVGQEATSTTGSAVAHTAVSENVAVRSVVTTETQSSVSMENTQKMAALMNRLGRILFLYKFSYLTHFVLKVQLISKLMNILVVVPNKLQKKLQ